MSPIILAILAASLLTAMSSPMDEKSLQQPNKFLNPLRPTSNSVNTANFVLFIRVKFLCVELNMSFALVLILVWFSAHSYAGCQREHHWQVREVDPLALLHGTGGKDLLLYYSQFKLHFGQEFLPAGL